MMKTYILIFAGILSLLTGCMKEPDSKGGNPNKVEGPVFDFSSTSTYTLSLGYNVPEGCIVDFDVYTEYPFMTDDLGQLRLKEGITPVERAFTDKKGAYNRSITVPAYVDKLYIFTTYPGVVSRLLTASVVDGKLSPAVVYKEQGAPQAAKAATRATTTNYNANQTDYVNFGTGYGITTLTLGKWYHGKDGPNPTTMANGEQVKLLGRPVTMSYVDKARFGVDTPGKDALKISADVYNSIRTALPGDGKGAVDAKYLQSGDIHVKQEAELDLVFIQNWGAYRNTLAYYCYQTTNPPKSVSDIKYQVIAIPNAMEQKTDYSISSAYDIATMYKGEGVKLKYVNPSTGEMSDKFPAGTSVGWILYRDGYNLRQSIPGVGLGGAPTKGYGANFSSPDLTQYANTAVLRSGDFVVVGFDDGEGDTSKRDYLDVVFNVQATPSDAIIEDIPDVEEPTPAPVDVKSRGILLYEDLWPFQGDFDMNDVVVGYTSRVTKNSANQVIAAEVDFTIMHSGADRNNSFAYYDPNISNATVTITSDIAVAAQPQIDRTNNIIRLADRLLDYANSPQKVTFKVKYEFNSPISNYVPAPFNPFITANSVQGVEVHLTNYPPTNVADVSWFTKKTQDFSNPALGLYYITFENPDDKTSQQLPFAVNISFDSKEKMNSFVITKEKERISSHYPGFKNWVKTNGKENQDWYLYHAN